MDFRMLFFKILFFLSLIIIVGNLFLPSFRIPDRAIYRNCYQFRFYCRLSLV